MRTFVQLLLQLIEVALLQSDLEMDDVIGWCSRNFGPIPGNIVRVFHAVARAGDRTREDGLGGRNEGGREDSGTNHIESVGSIVRRW